MTAHGSRGPREHRAAAREFWEPIRSRPGPSPATAEARCREAARAITIVHNEPVFLPIWLSYYSRFFAPEDIYVLDNDTTDGSTDSGGFVRIPVHHDPVDVTWMVETVRELPARAARQRYDVVLVTDVDEIVTPDARVGHAR